MTNLHSDILIYGAGLTGLMAAYALSDINEKVVLVDNFDFLSKINNNDLRTTAISEGSKKFLQKIGIWPCLEKFSQPIKYIKVVDRGVERSIIFNNSNGGQNLGYIIRNSLIKEVILKFIKKKKNIRFFTNQKLKNVTRKDDFLMIEFDKLNLETKLLAACDGKKSKIRDFLKTPVYKKNYKKSALVVNFHHSMDHGSMAYELFYNSGPLAILPMKKFKKNTFSSSLIWSHENEFINNLLNSKKKLLSLIIEEKIKDYVGSVVEIVDVQKFELSAHINSSFFEDRVIYLGDAAHSIHPIAGQGWNIGMRDIQKFLEVIDENKKIGMDIGSYFFCEKYNQKTYYDAYSFFQITDKLNNIFLKDSLAINKFREKGFNLINKNDLIKKYITNFAMGLN